MRKPQTDKQVRTCDVCSAAMVLLSTLPATARFAMQRVYTCSFCKFTVADIVAG
jgi:hypothetical protein